jgi:hypothetical protein
MGGGELRCSESGKKEGRNDAWSIVVRSRRREDWECVCARDLRGGRADEERDKIPGRGSPVASKAENCISCPPPKRSLVS